MKIYRDFYYSNQLPSLEAKLAKQSTGVIQRLDVMYGKAIEQTQMDLEDQLAHPDIARTYFESLAAILDGSTVEHVQSVRAAFHLAVSVANLMDWPVKNLADTITTLYDDIVKLPVDESRELMIDTAQEYLQHRPCLNDMIALNMPTVNATADRTFQCETETVYALTAQAIEYRGQMRYLLEGYSPN